MTDLITPADMRMGKAMSDFDDLDSLLGVEAWKPAPKGKVVECGQRPPREHTRLPVINLRAFEFSGYVARVNRFTCGCCDLTFDVLEGIFIEEKHLPSGTRRLQQMSPKGDFPMGGGHRKEVTTFFTPFCASCIGALGFDKEVDTKSQPKALVFKEN